MKIEKIICDRCGATIEEQHPDKVQLVKMQERRHAYSNQVIGHSYKTVRTCHLCKKCRLEFDKFMCVTGETE